MTYPHQLPSLMGLSNDASLVPLLIIGSGLSQPSLGSAKELAKGLAKKLTTPPACKAQHPEACYLSEGEPVTNCLYCMAEARLKELEQEDKDIHIHPRIRLAKELGLFDIPIWFGDADLPLGRNYPKHRAIARFVADHRFCAIVCLNWDCFLEAAFEAIGLSKISTNNDHPGKIKRFAVIVGDDQQPAECVDMFRLIKPHGCVKNLYEQFMTQPQKEPVIKITHSDLSTIKTDVTDEIKLKWKRRPLITCGWSGSERYLKEIADHIKPECSRVNADDRLSIIDLEWQDYHDHLASCYDTDKDHSFFGVTGSDINRFWLSLYTRYAIQKISGYAPTDEVKQQLNVFLASNPDIDEMSEKSWKIAIQFCDNFLPSWCRLCWRLGAVKCFREDQTQIPSSRIPLVPRDWHVPFDTGVGNASDQRPDLQAASILLVELLRIKENNPWRLDVFPCGLWHKNNGMMLVPVPTFLPDYKLVDLSGMKSLIEEIHRNHPFSRIQNISLLLLSAGTETDDDQCDLITRAFSSSLRQILPLEALLPLSEEDNFKSFKYVDISWIGHGGNT